MYCICEISNTTETIIKIINDKESFTPYIKTLNNDSHELLTNMTPNDINNDSKIKVGSYLLKCDDCIHLVEKCEIINKGYFYNSKSIDTKINKSWKVMKYELLTPKINNNKNNILDKLQLSNFDFSNTTNSCNIIIGNNPKIKNSIVDKIIKNDGCRIIVFLKNLCDKIHYSDIYNKNYENAEIYEKYDDSIVGRLFNGPINNTIVIFENCINFDKIGNNCINKLILDGKHHKITTIITQKTPTKMSPKLRCNIDNVFLLKDNIMSNKKMLYNNYAAMFPTYNMFDSILGEICVDNNAAMAIKNGGANPNLTDKVFVCKK